MPGRSILLWMLHTCSSDQDLEALSCVASSSTAIKFYVSPFQFCQCSRGMHLRPSHSSRKCRRCGGSHPAHPWAAQLQKSTGVSERKGLAGDGQHGGFANPLISLMPLWSSCLVTQQAWLPLISCLGESQGPQVDAELACSKSMFMPFSLQQKGLTCARLQPARGHSLRLQSEMWKMEHGRHG